MIQAGPAKKLTVYVDETEKVHGKPVYEVLMDICFRKKLSGMSVFRGVAGYGSHRVFHTAKLLELSTNLPVKIEIVDSESTINDVLPEITAAVGKGLIEISDTIVIAVSGNK